MPRLSPAVLALSLMAAMAATPAEANPRAFVASTGSDANTASSCGLTTACRTFAAALTVVDPGGEIVALDGAGYGAVTITKSVTITSNPGFYAGIAVPTGTGVTIATGGVNVTLRGLNINGTGANTYGVTMTNGNRLSIENCVISNFIDGWGVLVNTAAAVRIIDTLIRDGSAGVSLSGGATAVISGSKILGNHDGGVNVSGGPAGTTTTAAISDTIAAENNVGLEAFGNPSTTARMSVTRSTLSNNGLGAGVYSDNGTAVLTLSNSMVTGNTTGLFQGGVGAATLESLGNNTVRQNGANTEGTITTVSPM